MPHLAHGGADSRLSSLGRVLGALAAAALLAGCATTGGGASTSRTPGATAGAPATDTPAPQASVIGVFSSAVTAAANSSGSAAASCPAGEPLLGGGFIVRLPQQNGENGVQPDDSFPSSANTWTVTATAEAAPLTITAIAVCLKANFTVTTQVAQSSGSGGSTITPCPAGSALTGGGFQSGGGVNASSQPSGNGWLVDTGTIPGTSASPTVYAVCATQGLHAAAMQSVTKTVTNDSVTSNSASCPAGQLPVGGGYNGYEVSSDQSWSSFLNAPNTGQGTVSSGWMGEVSSGQLSPSAYTISSVCATY